MIARRDPGDLGQHGDDVREMKDGLIRSFLSARRYEIPYRHLILSRVFGPAAVTALAGLQIPAPESNRVSGTRELLTGNRQYFDQANIARHPVCGVVAETFQSPDLVGLIGEITGTMLDGCYLRIEYAQDTDGFWLKPHTDLGVKKLTMLCYLADLEGQDDLGTDLFESADTWTKRSIFAPDTALVFVPSDDTWHGFSARPINGVRKSVIINYVTDAWRAREQLAYPETPVRNS
jgi:hypothetical protein